MPTTRKSSRLSNDLTSGKQSTLSFNHRVTKSVPKSVKDDLVKPPAVEKSKVEPKEEVEDPVTEEQDAEEEEPEPETIKSEAELKAEKVSNASIERYWKKLEAERLSKRVHQEGLTTADKVLRYFDVSSQYGVCLIAFRKISPSKIH